MYIKYKLLLYIIKKYHLKLFKTIFIDLFIC